MATEEKPPHELLYQKVLTQYDLVDEMTDTIAANQENAYIAAREAVLRDPATGRVKYSRLKDAKNREAFKKAHIGAIHEMVLKPELMQRLGAKIDDDLRKRDPFLINKLTEVFTGLNEEALGELLEEHKQGFTLPKYRNEYAEKHLQKLKQGFHQDYIYNTMPVDQHVALLKHMGYDKHLDPGLMKLLATKKYAPAVANLARIHSSSEGHALKEHLKAVGLDELLQTEAPKKKKAA